MRCPEVGQGRKNVTHSNDVLAKSCSASHELSIRAVCTLVWALEETSSPAQMHRQVFIQDSAYELVCI
ncbi:hypothetical protein PS2_000430 [Malus domestica]